MSGNLYVRDLSCQAVVWLTRVVAYTAVSNPLDISVVGYYTVNIG